MQPNGYVRGFAHYSDAQLEQMKTDLSLAMTPAALRFCAAYYRDRAKRDPYIEELKLLDRFWSSRTRTAESQAPVQLLTNDGFVVKTYQDLLQKRRAVSPETNEPMTLREAMWVCTAYLRRVGRLQGRTLQGSLLTEAGYARTALRAPDGSCAYLPMPAPTQPYDANDLFLLLMPLPSLSPLQAPAALATLLQDEWMQAQIKGICAVRSGGVLQALIENCEGCYIDLNRLSRTGEPLSATMLTQGYEGDFLIRISPVVHKELFLHAKEHGIAAMAFARPTADKSITVTRGKEFSFSLQRGFLRALSPICAATLQLANETDGPAPAPLAVGIPQANRCAYLEKADTAPSQVRVTEQGRVYAAASTSLEASPFRCALEAAALPVLALSAAGIPYGAQSLAVAQKLPALGENDPRVATAYSALLGVYRLQSELAIPLSSGELMTGEEDCPMSLTVFAEGVGSSAPASTLCQAGNHLHLLKLPMTAEGLPDFAALRRLSSLLVSLSRTGTLKSAYVATHTSPLDAMQKMETDTLCCVTYAKAALFDTADLFVLVETANRIDAPLLGTVSKKTNTSHPTQAIRLPIRECLMPGSVAEVVVVSAPHDADAAVLAQLLTDAGAQITQLTPTEPDAVAYRLMTARAVLLCGMITLPCIPKLDFALDTLSRAGGYIIAIGNAKYNSPVPTIHLQNGISEEIIAQIAEK